MHADYNAYIRAFTNLRVDRSKGAPAPHKAILLLSVIQSVSDGTIAENKIYITAELVARFKDNWHLLVHDTRFTSNFSLPFYHLKSEGWWHLHTYPGRELILTKSHSIRSFLLLKETVAYAYLNEDLYHALQNEAVRSLLIQALLQTYFGNSQTQFLSTRSNGIAEQVVQQILHEDAVTYAAQVEVADEEELFIRSGIFKREIPRVYNHTCCITGMRLIATRQVQMIDACHIIPFSQSHDDTVSNGLSLCPNLHRAFDRYLITIDTAYRVLVSPHFTENNNDYSIKKLEGKQIILPAQSEYLPGLRNLEWHNAEFVKYQ